jgi:hypothetical protein
MQFSKYARRGQLDVTATGRSRSNALPIGEMPGWVCDTDARHFEGVTADAVWHV